jgi:hypothetical protein
VVLVEGALLIVPRGAFGRVDLAVMIGVDAVEAFAKAMVAIGFGQTGEPLVIGLGLLQSGLLARLEIGRR